MTFHHNKLIPSIALFNSKYKLEFQPLSIRDNIEHTLYRTGLNTSVFFDDVQCASLISELGNIKSDPDMITSFYKYKDGRIRSDMCRLAMLWRYGGYYFDNDIRLLDNVVDTLLPTTQLVTCKNTDIFNNVPGYFQAFLASVPNNPVIGKALHFHGQWFNWEHTRPEWFKRVTEKRDPNIGTILLRDAFVSVYGSLPVQTLELDGVYQDLELFFEIPSTLAKGQSPWGENEMCSFSTFSPCGFVVQHKNSKTLFQSRIASNGKSCIFPYCGKRHALKQLSYMRRNVVHMDILP